MADDDNFDIDIYGDDSAQSYQDSTVQSAPQVKAEAQDPPQGKVEGSATHSDWHHSESAGASSENKASGGYHHEGSGGVGNGDGHHENGTQQISSTGASANNQAFQKQAPQQQGIKRKQGEDDDRPIDPGATAALMINDLNWWISEEDIRGWANQSGCEDELNEVTFNEHKVNGKSKG